jgi:hypothetical protein
MLLISLKFYFQIIHLILLQYTFYLMLNSCDNFGRFKLIKWERLRILFGGTYWTFFVIRKQLFRVIFMLRSHTECSTAKRMTNISRWTITSGLKVEPSLALVLPIEHRFLTGGPWNPKGPWKGSRGSVKIRKVKYPSTQLHFFYRN